jgi:hypothetical protein
MFRSSKLIWTIAIAALVMVSLFVWHRVAASKSPKASPVKQAATIDQFTSSNVSGSKENVPDRLSASQELSLDRINQQSQAEMLGLVRNMTTEQRRMFAIRLSQKSGELAKISLFFKAWGAIDALAAFQGAQYFQNISQRENALLGLFQGAAPDKAAALVDQLRLINRGLITPDVAQELLSIGLSKWSGVDPQSAADFLFRYDDKNFINQETYKEVGRNWAGQDANAALAWKDKQDPVMQRTISAGIFQGWVAAHPDDAVQYAKNHLNDGLEGSVNASWVAEALAGDNPTGAKAFVEKFTSWLRPNPRSSKRSCAHVT